jgi:hypothetical protein
MSAFHLREANRTDCRSEFVTLIADFLQVSRDEVTAQLEVELAQPGTHVIR